MLLSVSFYVYISDLATETEIEEAFDSFLEKAVPASDWLMRKSV